jgi:hypothetical protein
VLPRHPHPGQAGPPGLRPPLRTLEPARPARRRMPFLLSCPCGVVS